ncbi:MAG: PilZ domain-containing protein [Novosphingobium sp.]|nr:PilZ domain-containing protein [Novosphingobium sp.]
MDRRREARIPVELPGTYRMDGKLCQMFYSQISSQGCRLSGLEHSFGENDTIEVSLGPIGPIDATVRWADDGTVGVEFDAALEAEVVSFFAAIIPSAA